MSSSRLYIDKQHRDIYRSYVRVTVALKKAADEAGISRKLAELINIRVSQMNRCATCLDTHVRAALLEGESEQRIALLPAWRDTELFTDKERAALALAEAATTLPSSEEQDRVYAEAREHFTDEEYSVLTWTAITINSFNRISIVSRHPVSPQEYKRKEDSPTNTSIIHNPDRNRFELLLDDNKIGEIGYQVDGDQINLTHTVVKQEHSGQGYAGMLAKHVLDDVAGKNLEVIPTCSYLQHYIVKHKDKYLHLVPEETRTELGM